jgi:hypothetical protein
VNLFEPLQYKSIVYRNLIKIDDLTVVCSRGDCARGAAVTTCSSISDQELTFSLRGGLSRHD